MNLLNYPEEVKYYLDNKASSKWKLEWNQVSAIENVIVVPAIAEFENIKNLIQSLIKNDRRYLQKSLVIFVINNSLSSDSKIKKDNEKSIDFLRAIISKSASEQFQDEILKSGINIGLVDASSEGKEFADKEAGVGLARKTGLDEALRAFDYSKQGKKILISLDADCTVDENYLKEIDNNFNLKNISVANIEFRHFVKENGIKKLAIISYEIFLRQYVTGLLFANSPFAFHTIGSILVCEHEAYTKAGGMNTKKAAEDFYFLQKLAKHYTTHKINSTIVRPSARESWRVPFGTGKSMADYLSKQKEILLYDPEEFVILKSWLEIFNSDISLNTESLLNEAKKNHPELYNFLEGRKFSADWKRILQNSKSEKQLNYQRKNWFDAFKTLKLIHHLRDTSFPMMKIKSGVEKLFNIFGKSVNTDSKMETDDGVLYEYYLSELILLENFLNEKRENLSI